MRKKLIFFGLFFGVLVLGFYFAMTQLIPGYGEVRLPVLSELHPFAFKDQEGRVITQKDVAGKVFVAEYFFTTCKGICPKMNGNLQKIAQAYAGEPDFKILSYTVDPETDTVGRMKRYADSLGADPRQWWFLTGRKDSLYRLARSSYMLDDPNNNAENIDKQFIHTQLVALVDKNGHVRKIYDTLKQEEMAELRKDIGRLLKEKTEPGRFGNDNIYTRPG